MRQREAISAQSWLDSVRAEIDATASAGSGSRTANRREGAQGQRRGAQVWGSPHMDHVPGTESLIGAWANTARSSLPHTLPTARETDPRIGCPRPHSGLLSPGARAKPQPVLPGALRRAPRCILRNANCSEGAPGGPSPEQDVSRVCQDVDDAGVTWQSLMSASLGPATDVQSPNSALPKFKSPLTTSRTASGSSVPMQCIWGSCPDKCRVLPSRRVDGKQIGTRQGSKQSSVHLPHGAPRRQGAAYYCTRGYRPPSASCLPNIHLRAWLLRSQVF